MEKYYQVLGKSLPHVLELVPQLKWVPSLTRKIFNPCLQGQRSTFDPRGKEDMKYLNCFRLVGLLDVLERFIEENISTGVRVFQYDLATE